MAIKKHLIIISSHHKHYITVHDIKIKRMKIEYNK